MKLAVVGVTGLVGSVMLKVLSERNFVIDEFIPVASAKSVGKLVHFQGKSHAIVSMNEAITKKPDIAIFSAGGSTSLEWAPKFSEVGTVVIDNSSAWRMDPSKLLIVPEINADLITPNDKILANPNCSTIQMVAALFPIHAKYGIERLVISTYQSFTGTGKQAVDQYQNEKNGNAFDSSTAAYHYPIFENCIPHCDDFLENGYTKEEMKLVHETKKILNDETIKITATAVRVPVDGGHSEAINIQLKNEYILSEIVDLLNETDGIVVQNNTTNNSYPMPLYAKGKDEVFVGRIRRDTSTNNALNMWVVSDNLRKGAATNAVQIAEYLLHKGYLNK
ncbi:MAG: aspartate-semialdehyde dehydrogenase [Saprospiraceae bacterium]